MVVSLTVVPVLAARYLARRRMPTTGPVYGILVRGYEFLLRAGLRFPRLTVLLALLAVLPGWWLCGHVKTGFMPAMDEGAFILDYWMPVGTSLAETDKVMRRVETILQDTPDVDHYLRRTGAEAGFFATEPFTGDILVSLKPAGQRRGMDELFGVLRERIAREVPELGTVEFVPLVRDQINDLAGVSSPVEIKIFGPDLAVLRGIAERTKKILERWESDNKVTDVKMDMVLGNPDIVVRTDKVQAAHVDLTEQDVESQLSAALYGQVAATLPERDRLTNIRVRYPDAVRFDVEGLPQLPISLSGTQAASIPAAAGTATSPGAKYVQLGQLAQSSARARPTSFGARTSSPSSPSRPNWAIGIWAPSTANCRMNWAASTFPPATAGNWRATTARSRNRSPACSPCSSWPRPSSS